MSEERLVAVDVLLPVCRISNTCSATVGRTPRPDLCGTQGYEVGRQVASCLQCVL